MEKKKSAWWWMNPMRWLDAAFDALAWLFGPILRFLGMMPPPRTDGFENLSKRDVDDAAKDATEAERAIAMILADRSPAEVVKAYAVADPATRETMDLSVLDPTAQDWLLKLTDDELTLLSMSTIRGCARSLESRSMKPIFTKPTPETATAEILRIPSVEDEEAAKREFVAASFRELFHAPGVANANPRYVPVSTVH
nr:hypothetical protein RKHAN_02539 [Rhizobium sp. Khangiran2]